MNMDDVKNTLYVYHGEYLSDSVISEIVRDLEQLKEVLDKKVEKDL